MTRELKAQASTALIPVVALTALAMLGQKQKAIAAGCSGYITKPVDTGTFVAQVKGFLAAEPTPSESINHHSQEASEREHHQAP